MTILKELMIFKVPFNPLYYFTISATAEQCKDSLFPILPLESSGNGQVTGRGHSPKAHAIIFDFMHRKGKGGGHVLIFGVYKMC